VKRARFTRLRRGLLATIGALYAASIPWYRDAGEEASVWLGLPDWVAVALLCYAAVAVLNSIAWLLSDVPDRDEGEAGGRE
jgi:hypothetical protein